MTFSVFSQPFNFMTEYFTWLALIVIAYTDSDTVVYHFKKYLFEFMVLKKTKSATIV